MFRAIVYKSSISIPVTVLFAFDYKKACLKLKASPSMIFSNSFTYTVIAIVFPLLLIILCNEIYELRKRYKYKSNATYDLVTIYIKHPSEVEGLRSVSPENLSDENMESLEVTADDTKRTSFNKQTPQSIFHTFAYVVLYLVVVLLLYLCLTIYFKLFLLISLPQHLMTASNILLSMTNILFDSC